MGFNMHDEGWYRWVCANFEIGRERDGEWKAETEEAGDKTAKAEIYCKK